MLKMLIIADDFTGALDTGIQFAKNGIITQVAAESITDRIRISENASVLVVDLETRKMNASGAYRAVYKLTKWAIEMKIPTIYKKTDSALRGNVGAELSAVVAASGENLYFIPAFPDMDRVTVKGKHYIAGVPLEDSAFKADPFDPVCDSYIPSVLGEYTENIVKCIEIRQGKEVYDKESKKIVVFDAVSNRDIERRIEEIKADGNLRFLAGCAGFASFLPMALELKGSVYYKSQKKMGMYVACGSLNPITEEQIRSAEKKGFYRISLSTRQKLDVKYYQTDEGRSFLDRLYQLCIINPKIIVDTFDREKNETVKYAQTIGLDKKDVRFLIAKCQGLIVKYLIKRGMDYTIFITGGDTLMGLMKEMKDQELLPVCELSPGVVLSRLKWKDTVLQIVSKSGGFGSEDVIAQTAEMLIENGEENYESCLCNGY